MIKSGSSGSWRPAELQGLEGWRIGRPVQEQTHLHRDRLQTCREETFPSHVEVGRHLRQTKVAKQIIFTSVEVAGGCRLRPAEQLRPLYLFFFISTSVHASFKPCFPVGPSADLTSGLHLHLCERALIVDAQMKWPKVEGCGSSAGWRTGCPWTHCSERAQGKAG